MTRLRILPFCVLLLVPVACGSSGSATKQLARPPDCRHPERESAIRATYCGSYKRIRAGGKAPTHPVRRRVPKVPCKVRVEEYFYAATNWLTLTKALARRASPCAQYYISIPPIQDAEGAWVLSRPKEPDIIHAFGPQFHAMAEVNTWPWGEWVQDTGKSWYDAGVLARERMGNAGYKPELGDIWAVNEFPLALTTSKGQQKAMTEFVHGLYDGSSKDPKIRGLIWKVAEFQTSSNLGSWRKDLESWFAESSFWKDMGKYVRSWSAEVYADPIASCPVGSPFLRDANSVAAYLEHIPQLVQAGSSKVAAARSYLEQAYTPLANAAWQWNYGFGITTIPVEQMQRFVSLQTYGIAAFAKAHPVLTKPVRIGFGWAPKNTTGLEAGRFHDGNHKVADALAKSIANAFRPDGIFPKRACGKDGRRCRCQVRGAKLNPGWLRFATGSR